MVRSVLWITLRCVICLLRPRASIAPVQARVALVRRSNGLLYRVPVMYPAPMRAPDSDARGRRRLQPVGCAMPGAREVGPVDADLPRATLEFLEDVRPGAGGKCERPAGFIGREGQRLLDEERAPGSWGRGLADHHSELTPDTAAAKDRDPPGGEGDPQPPGRGGLPRPVRRDPAAMPVGAPRQADAQPEPTLGYSRVRGREGRCASGSAGGGRQPFRRDPRGRWAPIGDVIVQDHHQRLARGDREPATALGTTRTLPAPIAISASAGANPSG